MPSWLHQGEALQEAILGADRVVVENAGHVVNMEAPEAFNRAVIEFLTAVESMSK